MKILNKWIFDRKAFFRDFEGHEEDNKKKTASKKKQNEKGNQNLEKKSTMRWIFDNVDIPKKIPTENKLLGNKQIERINKYKNQSNEFKKAESAINIFGLNSSKSLFDR